MAKKRKQRSKPNKSVVGPAPPDTSHDEQAEPVEQTEAVEQPETEQTEQGEQPETAPIEFDAAVALGRELLATIKTNFLRLGELADRVEIHLGEKTLKKWAAELGVSYESAKRYRSAHRAYKGKDLGETSPSAGVLAARDRKSVV